MPRKIHLSPKHQKELVALLQKHLLPHIEEVWAYGSRVNGRSHSGSDLDLVLRSENLDPIDSSKLSNVIDALRESNLPFLVQVQDWSTLPQNFHREIERQHVVLFAKNQP